MRVQGAWGPSGQAISDGLFLLGFCVSLRIWAPVGEYDKPSLSAWPSPVVPLGQTVTLQCHSRSPFAIFRLFKRDGTSLPKLQGHHVNTFTLGPVTREHAGSYTCTGTYMSLSVWSTHSDPLQIVVTVVFTKPYISAHPGPLVQAGENVTLHCHSPLLLDKFMLHKKGSNGHFQRHGETFTGGRAPADFSIGPMTLASVGTYRCYSSLSRSPYEWSAPSDPVDIVITDLDIMEGEPKEDQAVSNELSPPSPNPCHSIGLSNAQCPSLRKSHLNPSFTPPSSQDSPEDDVIYAHLDLRTLSERLNTHTSLSPLHPFPEPSIYEEFNVKKDRAEP
ncbi:putative killer cell immunoglobulin-like receptor-like protein KIR3DX1 [Dama dama]